MIDVDVFDDLFYFARLQIVSYISTGSEKQQKSKCTKNVYDVLKFHDLWRHYRGYVLHLYLF